MSEKLPEISAALSETILNILFSSIKQKSIIRKQKQDVERQCKKAKMITASELTYFIEGNDITALDIFIYWLSSKGVLNKIVNRYQIIYDGQHNLQLLYTISNRYKLGCPRKSSFRDRINNHNSSVHYRSRGKKTYMLPKAILPS